MTAVWADATTQTFSIQILGNATGSGRISQGGFFSFNIDNSTLDNNWSIVNHRASNLVSFTINLTNAINGGLTAIFDSGASPSAPGSNSNVITAYGGTAGVRANSGGTISSFSFTKSIHRSWRANYVPGVGGEPGRRGVAANGTFLFNADTD